jgi:hypothetical protein
LTLKINLPPQHEPAEDQNWKHRNQYERNQVPLEFHAVRSDASDQMWNGSRICLLSFLRHATLLSIESWQKPP